MFPQADLPIFATAVESFRFVFAHRRELRRIALFALPAFYLIHIAFDSIDWPAFSSHGLNATAMRALADLVVRGGIATIVLVAWHRVVMLKVSARSTLPPITVGLREFRYFVVWILLSVGFLAVFAFTMAAMVAVQFVAMLGVYLLLLLVGLSKTLVVGQRDQLMLVMWISVFFALPVASYITGRLSLVLPAMAVDRKRPLRQAWRLSAGNGWRLVIASLLVMLPMESIAALCNKAALATRTTLAYYPLSFAAAVSVFLLVVLTGTILSLFSLQLDSGQGNRDRLRSHIVPAE
jgi:hypothetical protein